MKIQNLAMHQVSQPVKSNPVTEWNNFKKTFSNLSPAEHRNPKIKATLKKHF